MWIALRVSGQLLPPPEAGLTDYMLYKAIALLVLAFFWNFFYGLFIEKTPPQAPPDTPPNPADRGQIEP